MGLIVIGLLIRMLLVKKKAAAKAEIEAVQKEDEWAEAQAAAETEAFGDTLDQEEIAAEAKEMSDAWGLPDQDDVDKVVSDSETMIGADGGGKAPPFRRNRPPKPNRNLRRKRSLRYCRKSLNMKHLKK